MSFVSMYDAGKIYSCVAKCNINIHQVNHRLFGQFCITLKQFQHVIREDYSDEFLKDFIYNLKKYRFKMCSSPRPYNDPSIISPSDMQNLSKYLFNIENIFPGYASKAKEVFVMLKRLASLGDNPLLEFLISFSKTFDLKNSALLLKEPGSDLCLTLSQYPVLAGLKIIAYPELRGSECFQRILIIGPNYWFPDFIFDSPRSEEIHIIKYDWLNNYWKNEPNFVGAVKNLCYLKENEQQKQPDKNMHVSSNEEIYVDGNEFIGEIDWEKVSKEYIRNIHKIEYQTESVMSKFILLEGDYCVYLEDSDAAGVLVLYFFHNKPRIIRVANSKLTPEMYILLRTSGGGDYIIEVADRIMGKEAENLRQLQKHWKSLFCKKVRYNGTSETSKILKGFGSERANEVNVRNWMSERNIKPNSYIDFQAIMKLIGEEKMTDKYWENARKIEVCHRRAGFIIRKLLLKKVLESDLTLLHNAEKIDFELEQAGGGSMTAFRVKFISQEPFEIPSSRLGVVNYIGREGKYG